MVKLQNDSFQMRTLQMDFKNIEDRQPKDFYLKFEKPLKSQVSIKLYVYLFLSILGFIDQILKVVYILQLEFIDENKVNHQKLAFFMLLLEPIIAFFVMYFAVVFIFIKDYQVYNLNLNSNYNLYFYLFFNSLSFALLNFLRFYDFLLVYWYQNQNIPTHLSCLELFSERLKNLSGVSQSHKDIDPERFVDMNISKKKISIDFLKSVDVKMKFVCMLIQLSIVQMPYLLIIFINFNLNNTGNSSILQGFVMGSNIIQIVLGLFVLCFLVCDSQIFVLTLFLHLYQNKVCQIKKSYSYVSQKVRNEVVDLLQERKNKFNFKVQIPSLRGYYHQIVNLHTHICVNSMEQIAALTEKLNSCDMVSIKNLHIFLHLSEDLLISQLEKVLKFIMIFESLQVLKVEFQQQTPNSNPQPQFWSELFCYFLRVQFTLQNIRIVFHKKENLVELKEKLESQVLNWGSFNYHFEHSQEKLVLFLERKKALMSLVFIQEMISLRSDCFNRKQEMEFELTIENFKLVNMFLENNLGIHQKLEKLVFHNFQLLSREAIESLLRHFYLERRLLSKKTIQFQQLRLNEEDPNQIVFMKTLIYSHLSKAHFNFDFQNSLKVPLIQKVIRHVSLITSLKQLTVKVVSTQKYYGESKLLFQQIPTLDSLQQLKLQWYNKVDFQRIPQLDLYLPRNLKELELDIRSKFIDDQLVKPIFENLNLETSHLAITMNNNFIKEQFQLLFCKVHYMKHLNSLVLNFENSAQISQEDVKLMISSCSHYSFPKKINISSRDPEFISSDRNLLQKNMHKRGHSESEKIASENGNHNEFQRQKPSNFSIENNESLQII